MTGFGIIRQGANPWPTASQLRRRPIVQIWKNLGFCSRRFSRMKFAEIVFTQSFQSHCLTVSSNFSVTVKNSPWSSKWVGHVRLPLITSVTILHQTYVLPLTRFYIQFFTRPSIPPIRRPMGCRLKPSSLTFFKNTYLVYFHRLFVHHTYRQEFGRFELLVFLSLKLFIKFNLMSS